MGQTTTAESLFAKIKRMPSTERTKFFLLLANKAFGEDDFTHEEVFGSTLSKPFSAAEAAEYLEISLPTLRRYVQSGKLTPSQVIGRNQMFDAQDLRLVKQQRNLMLSRA